jgi:DNA primase small subunit
LTHFRLFFHETRAAYKTIIEPIFEEKVLISQHLLTDPESSEKILSLLPSNIAEALSESWAKKSMPDDKKWKQLKLSLDKYHKGILLIEIAFQYSYPRLDVAVSKGLNHLLKSPFCVHPKTGKICVPIDPLKCDEFDPSLVPTVSDIVDDLDAIAKREGSSNPHMGYKGTRLEPYVNYFKSQFLDGLFREIRLQTQREKQAKYNSLDF